MADEALARLLDVARAAVVAAAHGARAPEAPLDLPPRLREPGGAFVTLHEAGGELRGCVGSIFPDAALVEIVRRMAAAAATRDPRFPSLRPEEFAGLRLEVSVLSRPERIAAEAIDVRAHGVCIRSGRRGAVLLPQVAARYGWDRETLLAELCDKAGLPRNAWRDPGATFLAFTAEIIEGEL
jgi:AmmeMemoRadiSam system protein A